MINKSAGVRNVFSTVHIERGRGFRGAAEPSLVPRPHPFLKGNRVSAVCVFTLGLTKKCAANQITVLKHVKLTCDSCSLRRVSTECVQSFTAPWQ